MDDTVEALAREAGALALQHFGRLGLEVANKGHLDLVTEADKAVERHIVAGLSRLFPEDGVLGEEGAARAGTSGRVWVIDPIDGTFNFVRGADNWSISIGLFAEGRPAFGVIYAPVRGQLFMGGAGLAPTLNGVPLPRAAAFDPARGALGLSQNPSIPTRTRLAVIGHVFDVARLTFRQYGASTMSLMAVAQGHVDGHFGNGESSWDVMAGFAILDALGFETTMDWSATPLDAKLKYCCGSAGLIAEMRPALEF